MGTGKVLYGESKGAATSGQHQKGWAVPGDPIVPHTPRVQDGIPNKGSGGLTTSVVQGIWTWVKTAALGIWRGIRALLGLFGWR